MKKLLIVFLAFLLMAVSANADSILPLIKSDGSFNNFEDQSIEWLINMDGDTVVGGSNVESILEEGDRLRGVIWFQNINDTATGAGTVYDELTGIFDITLETKLDTGTGFLYDFAPTATSLSGFFTEGTVAQFWTDASQDLSQNMFDPSISRAELEARASNDTYVLSLEMDGVDDLWQAFSLSDDILQIANSLFTNPGGSGVYYVSVGTNNLSGPIIEQNTNGLLNDGLGNPVFIDAQIFGNTNIYGNLANLAGDIYSSGDIVDDADAGFSAVPEPNSLILLGVGLLGITGVLRSRKKK